MASQTSRRLTAVMSALDELQERREVSDSARGRLRGILTAPLEGFSAQQPSLTAPLEGVCGQQPLRASSMLRASGMIRQSSRLSGLVPSMQQSSKECSTLVAHAWT